MGLDFTLYEICGYSFETRKDGFIVKEVLTFSNATASILVNWLYRNNCNEIIDKSDEAGSYILWYSQDIKDILDNLERVLSADSRDILALHYFPLKYSVTDDVTNCVMFSEDYYNRLKDIHKKLVDLLYGDVDNLGNRRFIYNVSW